MVALLGKLFPTLARPASRREELTELYKSQLVIKPASIVMKAHYYRIFLAFVI